MSHRWSDRERFQLTVQHCAILLIAVVLVVAVSSMVWLQTFNQRVGQAKSIATDYHLASVLHLIRLKDEVVSLRANCELVHRQSERSAGAASSVDVDERYRHHLSQALYAIHEEASELSALQAQYVGATFQGGLTRLLDQAGSLESKMVVLEIAVEDDLDLMLAHLDQVGTVSTQLSRLHQIRHTQVVEDLANTEATGLRAFLTFLAALLVVGGLTGLRLFKMLGRILNDKRLTEERYTTVLESSEDAVIATDSDGRTVLFSPGAERLLGWSEADALDSSMLKFWPSDLHGECTKLLGQVQSTGIAQKIEAECLTRAGQRMAVDVAFAQRVDETGQPVGASAILRDISDRKHLEKQLREAQKMEAVGQLAGGIAHDFNNLLQAINGYCEMALDELDEGQEAHEYLTRSAQAGEKAAKLVSQILAFGRRQTLEMKVVDLNEVIAGFIGMVGRMIGEHLEIRSIPGAGLLPVRADPGQIEQILMNLCVNARDAMPTGGLIEIETRNVALDEDFCKEDAWASPGRYILIRVADNGCGMDDATLASIFEPFFTTKEVGKGSGLGLSMVYGLVKQHQGLIHASSSQGEGTVFRIYLPVVEELVATGKRGTEGPVVGGNETILLAEDDDGVRDVARAFLEQAGYTVLLASDGEEALQLFASHGKDIHLALLDVMMPKLGGPGVYDRIRGKNLGLRFLFASGYSMDATQTDFVLRHGIALVQKPYRRSHLLLAVRAALEVEQDSAVSAATPPCPER